MLTSWKLHLEEDAQRSENARKNTSGLEEVSTEDDKSRLIEGRHCIPPQWALPLEERLRALDVYYPVLINDCLDGISSALRAHRLKKLQMRIAVKLYTHVHHGSKNLYFLWRLPVEAER